MTRCDAPAGIYVRLLVFAFFALAELLPAQCVADTIPIEARAANDPGHFCVIFYDQESHKFFDLSISSQTETNLNAENLSYR